MSAAPMRSIGISACALVKTSRSRPSKCREEAGRVGEVGLGHDEERADAGIQRRDEVAVDEPLARLGIGGRDDDEHLVGVGDDDPLHLVGVVGAAPQQRGALLDADDAGEGSAVTGAVADHARAVAGDDRHLAQLAGAHPEDRVLVGFVLVDEHGVAPAIDSQHAADLGIGVRRTPLRARAVGLRIRADAYVGLVELGFVVVVEILEPAHDACMASG